MDKEVFTRKELYYLVWSTPVLTLSKKYKVSESSFRSLCRKYNIPLPPAGHWRKVEYNKPYLVKPLPQHSKKEVVITLELRPAGEQDVKIKKQVLSTDAQVDLPIKVPTRITDPDPLIIAAKVSLTHGNGRYYQHGGLVWTAEEQLDIRVAPKNVGRALRFIDALIKLLRARGHDIEISYGTTYLVIENQRIEFQLKELMKTVYVERKYSYSNTIWNIREYQATGQFVLRVGKYSTLKEWKDGKLCLEDNLSTIVLRLEAIGEKLKKEQFEREKWRQEQQERLRIERELKEQKEREAQAFKDLLDKAQQWQQAKILRDYIGAVEIHAKRNIYISEELISWLKWAQQKADEMDPLASRLMHLLEGKQIP